MKKIFWYNIMKIPLNNHEQYTFETNVNDFNTVFTLNSIVSLFDEYFGFNDSNLTICIYDDENFPLCNRLEHQIYLNVEIGFYQQEAYQFSHELCHFMIPKDVCKNLRWFEEALCEMASIFFLKRMPEKWLDIHNSEKEYAIGFYKYAINRTKNETKFDITNNSELQVLENECYIRDKNMYIANLILPIFEKYPNTWRAVPYLCEIPSGLSFLQSLKKWIGLSPKESRKGLRKIIKKLIPYKFRIVKNRI